jgi:membrane protease YdiL (CAAX protease family)
MIPLDAQRAVWKVLLPAAVIALMFVIARRRRLSLDWLGVAPAPPIATLLWVLGYAAWMLLSNALLHWRGPWDFTPWQHASLLADGLRVLGVSFLGPIAEELVFRGFLYDLFNRRFKFKVPVTIAATAVLWALLHVQYTPAVLAVLAVDGVLLGLARYQSKSILPPILMHVVWNLYAIW